MCQFNLQPDVSQHNDLKQKARSSTAYTHNKFRSGTDQMNGAMRQIQRLWLALSASLATSTFSSFDAKAENGVLYLPAKPQDPSEMLRHGKSLRAELDKAVKTRSLSGGISGTDMTDVVLPYIPVGTMFGDAEAILRDAGFTIYPYPDLSKSAGINQSKDWYAVTSGISFFEKKSLFRTDLYVSLLPVLPGEYTNVIKVTATVFVTGP